MAAKVIECEGIDGSGKTTALKYLISELRSKGLKVLDTREVGSPHVPVCVKLRELILDPAANMDGTAMEFVFAAMRIENQRYYETVKNDYDFIVSDRGYFSHLAYGDHNTTVELTERFFVDLVGTITKLPDLVVFLKIAPETALKRRNTRNGFVDAIEAKGPGFQVKVYNSFIKYLDRFAVNRKLIDAEQNIEGVQSQIRHLVDDLIASPLE